MQQDKQNDITHTHIPRRHQHRTRRRPDASETEAPCIFRMVLTAMARRGKRVPGCHKASMVNSAVRPASGLNPVGKLLMSMEQTIKQRVRFLRAVEEMRSRTEGVGQAGSRFL